MNNAYRCMRTLKLRMGQFQKQKIIFVKQYYCGEK